MQNKIQLGKTKAGRRFMGFMRTFNSGDPAAIETALQDAITEESLEKHDVATWLAQMQYIYSITEGLRVFQVLASDEYQVVVLMQAQKDDRLHIIEMVVSEDYPHKIAAFVQRMAQS